MDLIFYSIWSLTSPIWMIPASILPIASIIPAETSSGNKSLFTSWTKTAFICPGGIDLVISAPLITESGFFVAAALAMSNDLFLSG